MLYCRVPRPARGGWMILVAAFVIYSDFLGGMALRFGKIHYLCGHRRTEEKPSREEGLWLEFRGAGFSGRQDQ